MPLLLLFGANGNSWEQIRKLMAAKKVASTAFQVPALAPGQVHCREIIVKKSRFITTIGHTSGMDECRSFIAAVSAQYADATHNCYAFNGDAPDSTAVCGCSDDGEPHGTAGQPMLNVVLHCGIGELTAVVTRYFGGTLLGTGGLVKAYQDAVKLALSDLPVQERIIPAYIDLVLAHHQVGLLKKLLPTYRGQIISQHFGAEAEFTLLLPLEQAHAFAALLQDKTNGRGQIKLRTD